MLKEQDLRDIYDNLIKQIKQVVADENEIITRFNLKLVDQKHQYEAQAEKTSLDEIFSEDNGDLWLIDTLEISISTKKQNNSPSIFLRFKRDDELKALVSTIQGTPPNFIGAFSFGIPFIKRAMDVASFTQTSISYKIIGEDRDWIDQTKRKIEERIRKIKRFPFSNVGANIYLCSVLTIIVCLILVATPAWHIGIGYSIFAFFMLSLLTLLSIAFMYGFPPYTFYWGDYKNAYDKKQSISKSIINIVIFGFLIDVVAGIITTLITK